MVIGEHGLILMALRENVSFLSSRPGTKNFSKFLGKIMRTITKIRIKQTIL